MSSTFCFRPKVDPFERSQALVVEESLGKDVEPPRGGGWILHICYRSNFGQCIFFIVCKLPLAAISCRQSCGTSRPGGWSGDLLGDPIRALRSNQGPLWRKRPQKSAVLSKPKTVIVRLKKASNVNTFEINLHEKPLQHVQLSRS